MRTIPEVAAASSNCCSIYKRLPIRSSLKSAAQSAYDSKLPKSSRRLKSHGPRHKLQDRVDWIVRPPGYTPGFRRRVMVLEKCMALKRSAVSVRPHLLSASRRSFSSTTPSTSNPLGSQLDALKHTKIGVFGVCWNNILKSPGRGLGTEYALLYPLTKLGCVYHKLNLPKNVAQDVNESQSSVWVASPKEPDMNWNDKNSPVTLWIRRLWVPALAVMTVVIGWRYPISLIVNLVVLVWSTKPSPSSIHLWLEQRRMEAEKQKYGLERLKEQLKLSTVMHVQVEDHLLFCLARVSSLTESMLLLGFLGDWWILHSSTMSIRY